MSIKPDSTLEGSKKLNSDIKEKAVITRHCAKFSYIFYTSIALIGVIALGYLAFMLKELDQDTCRVIHLQKLEATLDNIAARTTLMPKPLDVAKNIDNPDDKLVEKLANKYHIVLFAYKIRSKILKGESLGEEINLLKQFSNGQFNSEIIILEEFSQNPQPDIHTLSLSIKQLFIDNEAKQNVSFTTVTDMDLSSLWRKMIKITKREELENDKKEQATLRYILQQIEYNNIAGIANQLKELTSLHGQEFKNKILPFIKAFEACDNIINNTLSHD